jgi:type III restriction enzyme
VLGLELTATPYIETGKGPIPFKNIIYEYRLSSAMEDGFVKEPAVATRKDFNPAGMSSEEIEKLKLEDGIRLHETIKVELETYARETGNRFVKPFLLVIARDTTHAGQLKQLIESDKFFDGRYKEKVIQVDSSRTGAEEDEMVQRLLAVESPEEPTEIVIHVNMLKEGWDVTNLYTIVPLRAAHARVLIEQSIGRGLRLPYGRRTGVTAVDRLNIVAHDRFQEIVDEANKPDSPLRLQQTILDPEEMREKTVTIVSQPQLAAVLGIQPQHLSPNTHVFTPKAQPIFQGEQERQVVDLTWKVIRELQSRPKEVPAAHFLEKPEIQQKIVERVSSRYQPSQLALADVKEKPDVAAIVAKAAAAVVSQTIDIPRIVVQPKGVKSGYKPFNLDLSGLNYQAVNEDIWVQHLRTSQVDVISSDVSGSREQRLADYVVRGLVNFDDISYVDTVDLLYDLALQMVDHFRTYLTEEETARVLRVYERPIASFIHAQMQNHYFEDAVDYEVTTTKGFTELREQNFTAIGDPKHFREPVPDKVNIAKYVFGGFARCLYPVEKFQSDTERRLAVILDRDSLKWFRPAKGQFLIFYKRGAEQPEYQPDFVAETESSICMIETKARNEMNDPEVLAKRDAAVQWCERATIHADSYKGKPWKYLLIPHDAIADNITLSLLEQQFVVLGEM